MVVRWMGMWELSNPLVYFLLRLWSQSAVGSNCLVLLFQVFLVEDDDSLGLLRWAGFYKGQMDRQAHSVLQPQSSGKSTISMHLTINK